MKSNLSVRLWACFWRFRPMIYLKLILYMMWGFNQSSFSCICAFSCLGIIYWKHLPFSIQLLLHLFEKSVVWFYFWSLYSHWVTCLSILTPHCLGTEMWNQLVDGLHFALLFQFVLAMSTLHFHMNFRISLSIATKSLLRFWLGPHWLYRSICKRSINCWPWLLHLWLTKGCPLILLKCEGHCYYWMLLVKCIHIPDANTQM